MRTAVVFLLVAAFVFFVSGTKCDFTNDEGIYFEGAKAIIEGKALYKDHFAFTGPGCYWFVAVCFRLFGITLLASRVPLILDIACIAAVTFWLVARLINARAAIFTAVFCVALMVSDQSMQSANHRWDSTAFACLAIAFACSATWTPKPIVAILGGLAAAASAWATPTAFPVCAVVAWWLWRQRRLTMYLLGGLIISAPALIYMTFSGSLQPMFERLLWARANYLMPNTVFYGSINGGLERLFEGTSGIATVVTGIIVFGMLVPTLVPIFNLVALPGLLKRREHSHIAFLWLAALALVITPYPRMDAGHLLVVCAPAVAVTVYTLHPYRWGRGVLYAACVPIALLAIYTVQIRLGATPIPTRIGTIHADDGEITMIRSVERRIEPGSSLFVYPYLPILYSFSAGVNPTPYSFLQPGMMTENDERSVIVSLEKNPPKYTFFMQPPLDEVLRIWPNTRPDRLRMALLEGWITSNYDIDDPAEPPVLGYRLLRRRGIAR